MGKMGMSISLWLTVILHVYEGYTQEDSAGNISHSHRYVMVKFRTQIQVTETVIELTLNIVISTTSLYAEPHTL